MEKLFLFDFDGVIVDSLGLYEEISKRCLQEIGQPIAETREDFLNLFEDNFYEAMAKKGVNVEAFNSAVRMILPSVDYDKVVPFYDLIPVLEKLCYRNILLIVSSNSLYAIQHILSKFQFNGCFRDILSADFSLSKREKIEYAINQWKTGKNRTFFVGDTIGDVKEAKAAGVKSVAVTWGWHSKDRISKENPDHIIETPEELLLL